MLMGPIEGFMGKREIILRPNYEELCRRYKAGEDTRPPTKAEVLPARLAASLVTPFRPTR